MRAFLLIVLMAIVAGGFWLGWFNLSTSKASGKDMVQFTVDRDKVSEDTENVRHKANEATRDKNRDTAGRRASPEGTAEAAPENIQGIVKEIDAAAGSMVVSTAGSRNVAFMVGGDASIQVNGRKEGLAQVRAGDRVRVGYRTAAGRNEVIKVVAAR